jgi:VWFA-related protein
MRIPGVIGIGLAAVLAAASWPLVAAGQSKPAATAAPQFRTDVDLISVEAQVLDRQGRPVQGLGPEAFEVTIDGRKHRVVSAQLVDSHPAGDRALALPETSRTIMIAVDCASFSIATTRNAVQAARGFIERLAPADRVGLFAYPIGPQLDPTTDHAAVIKALDRVTGQKEPPLPSTRFNLRAFEVIEINSQLAREPGRPAQDPTSDPPTVDRPREFWAFQPAGIIVRRHCGDLPLFDCTRELIRTAEALALAYEGEATVNLGNLRSLLAAMGKVPGRKSLVLLSGGLIASDQPGGRPDIGDLGHQVGREAALSNTSVYTINIDTSADEQGVAQMRDGMTALSSGGREMAIFDRWLSEFSDEAGGRMFKVLAGYGEAAYDRILSEMSAYYLLGVEPLDRDRDGKTHEIHLKVKQSGASIRGRRWVAIPKPGAAAADASNVPPQPIFGTGPMAGSDQVPKPPVREPRPLPSTARALADAFSGHDFAAWQGALASAPNLASLLRDVRLADRAWEDNPRLSAAFALDIGLAGLRSDNGYARDEGGRLLASYNTLVRQQVTADAFECAWLTAQAAGLEGIARPAIAAIFVGRARIRCPQEPRLALAWAIVAEQQYLRGSSRAADAADAVVRLYTQAAENPSVAAEACLRSAWFLHRQGRFNEAFEQLGAVVDATASPDVRYLSALVRGQIARALSRPSEAEAAYRAALEAVPGAQAARVALMTLLVVQNRRDEASALADAVQSAPGNQADPWSAYDLGDSRLYPVMLANLRELAR